ncbi:hypothetical protein FOYG_06908 [Fusarium oxysporum NRRL 32931]|uniref:Uncharacterized protein n=1 Tax=Fusarium oxysporum NRRL 32931 TaxID=660029 RepID=W9IL18_FUSOX|nr:hypothetical protein FOYG_06908 [Fusarium oxysporum NRRL 32931]
MNGLEIPPSLVDSKINAPEHEEGGKKSYRISFGHVSV